MSKISKAHENKLEIHRNKHKTGRFTTADPSGFLNRDSDCKIDTKSKNGKSKAEPLQSPAKLDETMAKSKTTYFHFGVKK
jgi:hypothetical protein